MPILPLSLLGRKLFTSTGVFLSIFVLIFAVFLFYNSNTILSSLGFETTANVKAELARTQEELKQLKAINDNLNAQLKKATEQYKLQIETITQFQRENEAMKQKITNISRKYAKIKAKKNKEIKETAIINENSLILPLKLTLELSGNNIDALNSVYHELY